MPFIDRIRERQWELVLLGRVAAKPVRRPVRAHSADLKLTIALENVRLERLRDQAHAEWVARGCR